MWKKCRTPGATSAATAKESAGVRISTDIDAETFNAALPLEGVFTHCTFGLMGRTSRRSEPYASLL
jgi:hypothetical protein